MLTECETYLKAIPVYLYHVCHLGFCVRRDAMQTACFTVSDETVQHTLIRGQCVDS